MLPLSVNVSRRDLQHADVVEKLVDLVQRYEIPIDLLRLEITESAFAGAQKENLERVRELIRLGFTVEIDDFGSGYSSLNTLKDVPAAILKLDMRFFESTENEERAGNIIESVVHMARWLNMGVIAEGVEHEYQADYLMSIGCYDIQGYYYAKPMPVADYEKRLERLEEESRSKTTFLSRMSHEIRTPMNGIIGMLTLAENKLEVNSPAMQYLTKADELSDHLIALINDILDMSRIEVGKVELEQGVFSLRALGNRLYDMFAKNLDSRGIRYEVNFEGVTVDYVCGDELRISQVIINFLSNAVKFTSEGEIIVTFRQMMLQNGVADWCSMRQRLDLVCLVY